ncbi:MAG: hypothetical protein ACLQEQ_09745 [Nitrososphaerales archaeon]
MRKAVAILGLALMAVGIILTAFGTQQVSALECQRGQVCQIQMVGVTSCDTSGLCQFTPVPSAAQPNFTLNYVGISLAVLGAVFFASFYPKRSSISLPANAVSLRL